MEEFDPDELRERKAIDKYCSVNKLRHTRMGHGMYRIDNDDGTPVGYVLVEPKLRNMSYAYPLQAMAKKVIKLIDKRLSPVIIWACDDGILFANADKIKGSSLFKDNELMLYFDRQPGFRYIRY